MTDTHSTARETAVRSSADFVIGGELRVRRLGFGAGRIVGPGYWGPPADPVQAVAVLRRAVERGVNLIDTADNYGNGISEELIAQALHPYPDDLVIATKGGVIRTGPNRWHEAGRPGQLAAACHASLRRLRLDTIDLYQLHRIDPAVPLAEQLGALVELQRSGRIRHIGLDTVTLEELHQGIEAAPIAAVQNQLSFVHRESEPVVAACEARRMAFMPYLPLGGGTLARAETPVTGGALREIARERGIATSQLALAWLLHRSPVLLPTPGTASPVHLDENLAAAEITLTSDEMRVLSA